MEDGAQSVNNVVHSMRLSSTVFDKKSYLTYLKVGNFESWPNGSTLPIALFPLI